MAVNQSHTEDRRGATIPVGESLLKQYPDVELSFPQQPRGSNLFNGTKRGTLFLTSYRVIFVTSRSVSDPMLSFMMPFELMKNCSVEQPVFAANYIKGTVYAAPDGGWEGEAIFKLVFRKGGAIHFAELLMKAASAAARGTPLGIMNYWVSPAGIYVIPGDGSMCTPQTPCQVFVYGANPAGYGATPVGYGTLPAGYGALPPGYGAPPAGYGAPSVGYVASPAGYVASPAGYVASPAGYVASPAGYVASPVGYVASPVGYGAPPEGYGAPSPGYGVPPRDPGSPPSRYEAPPPGYEDLPAGSSEYGVPTSRSSALPAGSGAWHRQSVAPQTPEYEASPSFASSSQAYSPTSKM